MEKRIHLLRVGWRNLFSSCDGVSFFIFLFVLVGNRFWFYILLMYLEYHTVGCYRVQLVRQVAQEPLVRGSNPSGARVQWIEGLRVAEPLVRGSNLLGCWSVPPQFGVRLSHVQSGYTLT
jgi:hypothetical protein